MMAVLFKGSTGTTYTGLSVGDHMIVIRFTPSGSSQSSTLNPALTFTIAPTPTPTPAPGDYFSILICNHLTIVDLQKTRIYSHCN